MIKYLSMEKRHYESLIVWQEAHMLCMHIYDIIKEFPSEERFCLCSQIRRAAYSIPMNIVEGNTKRSPKEKLHFLEHSEASLEELDYQLLLSRDRKYISSEQFENFRKQIGKVGYLLKQFRSGISNKHP